MIYQQDWLMRQIEAMIQAILAVALGISANEQTATQIEDWNSCFVDLDHSNCYYQLLSYTIVFGGLFNYRVFCQHFCIFSCQD